MMYGEDCCESKAKAADLIASKERTPLPEIGMMIVNALEKSLAIKSDIANALGRRIEITEHPSINSLLDCMNLILVLANKNCEAAKLISDVLI